MVSEYPPQNPSLLVTQHFSGFGSIDNAKFTLHLSLIMGVLGGVGSGIRDVRVVVGKAVECFEYNWGFSLHRLEIRPELIQTKKNVLTIFENS